MSRIGNKPIVLPEGVKLEIGQMNVLVEGPKGRENAPLFSGINVRVEENTVFVKLDKQTGDDNKDEGKDRKLKALHGLVRALLNNCVIGTTEGFKKELEIKGVGYRAQQKGHDLQFQLGFSHDVIYKVPEGITVTVKSPTELEVAGTNKEKVGQVSAEIRSLKKPEPYKGKGIRYKDEYIKMKAGKAGK